MRLLSRASSAPTVLLWLGCAALPSLVSSALVSSAPARVEGAAPEWRLLHRARSSGVDLPVQWLSRLAWTHTGGEAIPDALGRVHLPLLPSSRDVLVLEEAALRELLGALPEPAGPYGVAPPAAGLVLTWEPGVELVDLASAEWFAPSGEAATRVSFREVREPLAARSSAEPDDASGQPAPPAELRAVVTHPEPGVHPSRASKGSAGLGYLALTESGARFSPAGELDSGADPGGEAWLCVARDDAGRLRLWFEADADAPDENGAGTATP